MLLSIMHDTSNVDEGGRNPDVTANYKVKKGDDETVDHLCGTYTVPRLMRLILFYSEYCRSTEVRYL